MKSEHRIKGFAAPFVSLALALALVPSASFAQQKRRGGSATRTASPASKTDERAEAQRSQAISLLIETADGARAFKDLLYRARIQSFAADALWSYDEARARAIFRRAWEAATASDRAEQRLAEEESGVFSNSEELGETAARDEVLARAAKRDAKLAEGFMRELVDARERASERAKSNQSSRRTTWRELSPLGARRLALAYELLNKGELVSSALMAEPLINEGVSGDLVEFLLRFRFRLLSPGAYEPSGLAGSYLPRFPFKFYERLVEKTTTDPRADANDLLLLSSFLISPNLLMAVDERGSLQFRSIPSATVIEGTPDNLAAKSFYKLALHLLLQRSPLSARATVQERIARYVTLGRLVPFFEKAGPEYAQYVPVMRSQMAAISGEMETGRRESLNAQFELTSMTGKNARDPLAPQLEQLSRAGDKYERDRISFAVARRAARERLWDRAQRAAYGIEDADLRRAALAFIVVHQIADISRAYKDDKEDDFESVARFVRRAEAPPFASAWGLAQAAVIAARKKESGDAVNALLSEAQSYAERADKDSRQRVSAYVVITYAAARVKSERTWDFLSELVRAANSTPDYMGDETELPTSSGNLSEGSDLSEELMIASDSFRLDTIFATMARIDFDKTLAQAQALTGETARAFARIAAARAALEKK